MTAMREVGFALAQFVRAVALTIRIPYQAAMETAPGPAQNQFGCSSSARLTRSTACGITSPMPAHDRSVTALS